VRRVAVWRVALGSMALSEERAERMRGRRDGGTDKEEGVEMGVEGLEGGGEAGEEEEDGERGAGEGGSKPLDFISIPPPPVDFSACSTPFICSSALWRSCPSSFRWSTVGRAAWMSTRMEWKADQGM